MKTQRHNRGFVALISVVVIGAVLTVLMYTLSASSFFSRFDALGGENKRASLALAESCVNSALLRLAQNSSYTPAAAGDKITISSGKNCTICTVSPSIVTRATYNNAYSNLMVGGTLSNGIFTMTNWQENPSNTVPACTNL